MAVLRGQDALNYIQNNPSSNFKFVNAGALGANVANSMAPTQQKSWAEEKLGLGGFLGDIASTISQPFRTGILSPLAQIVGTIGDFNTPIGSKADWFTTEKERQGYWADPLAGGVKSGAGIASFVVPGGGAFGGGIKGALKSGATSGAMSGFSASEGGKELEGILGGGLSGGLTSGAMSAVGKGVGKLSKIGGDLQAPNKKINELVQEYGDYNSIPNFRIEELPRKEQKFIFDNITREVPINELNAVAMDDKNALQRIGRDVQLNAQGIKAPAGTIDFEGLVKTDKNAINWALKEADLGKASRSNISKLPARLGELRKNEVSKLNIQVDSKDIIDKAASKLMRTSNIANKADAENMVRSRLQEVLSNQDTQARLGLKTTDPKYLNMLLEDKIPLDQNALFELTQKLGDDTRNVLRQERIGNFDPSKHGTMDAGRQIDSVVSDILGKESPKINQINKAYTALYRQNPGIIQSANRGGNISLTGGLASVPTQLWTRAEYWGGLGIEELGDQLAKVGIPDSVVGKITTLPVDQARQVASRLAPIYAGRQQGASGQPSNTSIQGGQDMQFGAPMGGNQPMYDQQMPTGMGGTGGYANAGQTMGMGMNIPQQSGMDPRVGVIAQAVLSGRLDPARAKYISEILGIQTPGGEKGVNTKFNRTIDQLENLYGVGTNKSLATSPSSPILGGFANLNQDLRKATDTDFVNRLKAYQDMRALAIGVINQARGAGTLNSGEANILMENMPTEYTSETAAKAWFDNIRNMLGNI